MRRVISGFACGLVFISAFAPTPNKAQGVPAFDGYEGDGVCRVADPSGTPLNVRDRPAGDRIVGRLRNNTIVESLGSNGPNARQAWMYIRANAGSGAITGWVWMNYIRCGEEVAAPENSNFQVSLSWRDFLRKPYSAVVRQRMRSVEVPTNEYWVSAYPSDMSAIPTRVIIVVNIPTGGSGTNRQSMLVLRRQNNYIVARDIQGLYGEINNVTFSGNQAIVQATTLGPNDPHCCPSLRVRYIVDLATGRARRQ